MKAVGIDIGSTACKAVLMSDDRAILGRALVPIGTGTAGPARVFEAILQQTGVAAADVDRITATGYGRFTFRSADSQKSELSCHAKGISLLLPGTGTIIDIGGQDIKVMRLNPNGTLADFVMNDKCAAGTGRFLDTMAKVLSVDVTELGALSEQANGVEEISSTCTVFAESEVISKLAGDVELPNLVAGIHLSVARRVATLVQRCGISGTVAMSGGVALNQGLVRCLQQEIGVPIRVHQDCQLAGAIGAALYALEETETT